MKVLKGVLNESKAYYVQLQKEIKGRLSHLPAGSIKKRRLNKQIYYYLQYRSGSKVIHKYLGKRKPVELGSKITERRKLENELKKISKSLIILKRIKGRKRNK